MRVEQQNASLIDTLKQNIGPEEKEGRVTFSEQYFANSGVNNTAGTSETGKSVNVKDATYAKPTGEEKQGVAEEIEKSSAMDATERKNQMAVLANTTSPEDYAKMEEDGFSLDDTNTHTIVTETDKIKAQLAKAGVDISFFGDDLTMEQLEAITGSAELATQIVSDLRKWDLPVTEDNVRDTFTAMNLAGTLKAPSDGAIKYMLDNGLEPTIENLYRAEFSGSAMYQGNTGESVDISDFSDQVENVIRKAGYPVCDQTKADCQWMIENDIPLTEENFKYMEALKGVELPMDNEQVMEQIAVAVSEGERPENALLITDYSMAAQAQRAFDVVNEAGDEELTYLIERDMDLTVQNLEYALAARAQEAESGDAAADAEASGTATGAAGTAATGAAGSDTTEASDADLTAADGTDNVYTERGLSLLTARRQLEETRLLMTVQANYSLLRQGISIDTEPLEKLVEDLKNQENSYYRALLGAQGADSSEENIAVFRETTEKISGLKTVPAYVLGMREVQSTIDETYKAGNALRERFEQANERYETLMTAPRADLGDSIQKAFQNVDDILEDLGLEATAENSRAVRILGYNQLDINAESIAMMKQADEEVQRVFRNLTPATVTEMIKQGINPLDMDFTTLNQMAEQIGSENESAQDNRKFSEFLWKLEQNNAITEEERSAYIGTYRLIHQVEQTDGAAIGALVNQGADITMRNLMMAVRSANRSGNMEYTVDNSFGENEGGGYQGTSITDQIEASYQNNCLKDVAEDMTPEKLRLVMSQEADWENMTPEQFRAALAQVEADETGLDYTYAKEQLAQLEQSADVAGDIYEVLEKYDIPNTMANVLAMDELAKNRNGMFRQIFGKKAENVNGTADDLSEAKEQLLDDFCDAASSPEALGEVQERLGELAEDVMKGMINADGVTSLDVREMRMLSAQLKVTSIMAKEEQYSVPVMVSDGVVNVSLKIVRGVDKKGVVDITMESELRGKIAATFQAKENGISGFIATDNEETKALLEGQTGELTEQIGEENADMHCAYLADLDFAHFGTGLFGANAQSEENSEDTEGYQVQTVRLYRIAEKFIRQMRDVL